jgi:transcriptional regulator with PAS, ATPase and Fis domain
MIKEISSEALNYLISYRWPGNVRELENVLGRAVIYMKATESKIELSHIPKLEQVGETKKESNYKTVSIKPLTDLVEEFETRILSQVLTDNNGNKTATAKQLNISLRSLYYKLEKYNILHK